MAYEISSSVAAQLTDYTANLTTISASYHSLNGAMVYNPPDGGRFSPDGTKLALNVVSRNGGDGSSIDYGIDIWHTSSAGWTLQESIDTGTKSVQQIEWYNDHEIWALLYNVSQPNRFVSSSSGWSTASDHTSYAVNSSDGLSGVRSFQFSRDKKAVALYNSNNGSWDDVVRFIISGSTPWDTRGQWDGNVPNIDNLHWGGHDENGMYRVFVGSTSEEKVYNIQVNPTTGETNYYGDFHSHYEGGLSPNMLYWHEDSNTLIVGQSSVSNGTATNHQMHIYAYQSSSAAFIADPANRLVITSSVDCAITPFLQTRWISGSTDAFIFGSMTKYSSQFYQGALQALESGSEGWKWTVIDGLGAYASPTSMIDISSKGDIFYDAPRWKKGVDMNHHDDDQWRQSFPNNNQNRVDDGVFNIRRYSALDNSDTTGPSVSSVAITSATNAQNSTLNEGDVVSVTVTMDEATVVNTTGGTPFITLSVGGVSRNASYASGTGTTSLIFQYTIASSETTDSDGISIGANAISLNSGTMQDASGNNATITHSAVSANSSFKVDTTKPTISSLSVAADNSTVTVTFAEDVYASSNGTGDLVAADFTLGLSGGNQASISLNATPSAISKTAQNIWVLTLNGTDLDSTALGTETLSVDAANNTSIFDLAGNAHTAAASTVSLNDTATISDSATETIGSGGGTVKAGNTNASPDVTVTIPSNALSTNVSIGASVATAFDPKSSGVTQAGGDVGESLSPIIRLTPHGQTFDQAVTVQFKLEGSAAGSCPSNLQIWKRNSATGVWYQLPSDLWSCSSGTISISTTSFSDFAALGGNNMARTKINNVQLARLTESNKVLPEAINITGSAESKVTSVNDSDVFIIQQAGNLAKHVSGSALKSYFAGGGVDVTASAVNENYRLTFVDHQDTSQIGLAVDSDLLYNPSTNTMTVATVSSTNVDGILGANTAAAATVTTLTANTSILPDAVGGADIGSTGAEFGDVYIADDKKIYFGNDQDASIEYDEDGTDTLSIAGADVLIADDKKLFFGANKDASFEYDEDGTDTLLYDGASLRINDDTKLEFGAGGDASFEYDEDGTDTLLYTGASMRFTDDVKLEFGTGGDASIEYDEDGTDQLRITGNSIFANNVEIDGTINADSTSDFADTMTLSKGSGTALTVSNGGAAVFNGDVDLGNATSDTITATGRFDSDLVPSTNNARALGSDSLRWNVHAENITASAIQVQQLDVVEINSITQTETTLEINDKLIVSALSASSAQASGGGLRIGGGATVSGSAEVVWNHASSSLDFAIGDEAQLSLKDGALLPSRDDNVDLGSSAAQFKDLHLDGTANIDSLVLASGATVTAVLDEDDMTSNSATALATQQSIKAYVDANGGNFFLEDDDGTEVQITNSKEIKFIGSGITTNWTDTDNGTDGDPYDLTFTVDAAQTGITSVLNASLVIGRDADNDIDFATDNEITFRAGGEDQLKLVDGALTPSSNAIVDLGTDALEFKDLYIDGTAYLDAVDIDGGNIDGTAIGAASPSTIVATTITANTSILPDAAGGADIGSTGAEFGDVYIADDKRLYLGSDQDASIEYDENGTDQLRIHQPAAGVVIAGTNPKLVIGDAGEEDTMLVFDGAEEDFRIGLDDGTNVLEIGSGASHGAQIAMKIDGSENVDIASHNGSTVGLKLGGTLVTATAAEMNLIDGGTARGTTALASGDGFLHNDGGTMRMTSVDKIADFLGGGDGLQVSSGVLSITAVEDIYSATSKGSGVGTLSNDLVTASLSQDAVTGSIQVYLNGMLQTPSGSVDGVSGAIFDYILATASFTSAVDGGTYTHRDGPPRVIFAAAIDTDDVIQLRYIKK